jgi:peroxiredoxin family protein
MSQAIPQKPFSSVAAGPSPGATPEAARKVAIIVSKGSVDMVYPGLILANAARMSGIEAMLFFTFWGLDTITEKKIDLLHVSTVGNPSMPMPTLLGGLPGMESLATAMMKKQMKALEIPSVREMLQILRDRGAGIYACSLAMDMFKLKKEDLVPQVEGVPSAMDFLARPRGPDPLHLTAKSKTPLQTCRKVSAKASARSRGAERSRS